MTDHKSRSYLSRILYLAVDWCQRFSTGIVGSNGRHERLLRLFSDSSISAGQTTHPGVKGFVHDYTVLGREVEKQRYSESVSSGGRNLFGSSR
jgi:hypothetical protein